MVAALVVMLSAAAPAPAAVLQRSFRSSALNATERYAVYLPAGYATSHRRYPVIYALHGLPGSATSYENMPIAAWGEIAQDADDPAIVVAPQGARPGDSDPEWHDWAPGRNWESAVAKDLVGVVDRTYRTIPNRRGRAIIGMSAGGYGAALIGLHNLAVFSVIQSWSGYFHPTNPAGTAPLDVGSPIANLTASAHSFVPLLPGWFATWQPTYFSFYIGDQDTRFLAENRQLDRELRAAGVAHHFAVYPGGHTSALWSGHARTWIDRAMRELSSG
jgi:enterochelin esterase-like enzyme